MKTWNVYQHESGDIVAIKAGFNWWGLFFPQFAPFFLGLQGHAIFALVIVMSLGFAEPAFALLVSVVLGFVYAFNLNGWASAKLEKNGFRLAGTVQAASSEGAKAQFTGTETERTP